MDPIALLGDSRREHELYGKLLAVYGALEGLLMDEQAAPADLTAATHEASWLTAALAEVDARLAPTRGARVSPEVAALRKASAGLAARAAEANLMLRKKADARRDRLTAQRHARLAIHQTQRYAPATARRTSLDTRA
jgi:hypothetical protein